jgi:hypothetical protein
MPFLAGAGTCLHAGVPYPRIGSHPRSLTPSIRSQDGSPVLANSLVLSRCLVLACCAQPGSAHQLSHPPWRWLKYACACILVLRTCATAWSSQHVKSVRSIFFFPFGRAGWRSGRLVAQATSVVYRPQYLKQHHHLGSATGPRQLFEDAPAPRHNVPSAAARQGEASALADPRSPGPAQACVRSSVRHAWQGDGAGERRPASPPRCRRHG